MILEQFEGEAVEEVVEGGGRREKVGEVGQLNMKGGGQRSRSRGWSGEQEDEEFKVEELERSAE